MWHKLESISMTSFTLEEQILLRRLLLQVHHNLDKIILVSGATGQQGGATARHLLANGWPVRALTRDARKPAAQALAAKGAEIVEGDFDDRASLAKALEGAYGAFSVQNFWLAGVGVEGEIRQGKSPPRLPVSSAAP
jgi:hypothetical protein